MVQHWVHDATPIARSLERAGFTPEITRVDIEPALNAALGDTRFDLVIYDPSTPSISLAAVESCVREHDRAPPIIVADDPPTWIARVQRVLKDRQS